MIVRLITKTWTWLQELVSCRCESEAPVAVAATASAGDMPVSQKIAAPVEAPPIPANPAAAAGAAATVEANTSVPPVPEPEPQPTPPAQPEPPHPTSGPLAEADALMQKDQAYAALKIIESFLAANPKHEDALLLHGLCLEQAGRHEEGLVSYQAALSNNPNCALAKARLDLLTPYLVKPAPPSIPTLERPYKTGIPRDTLMQIELATHAYLYKGVLLIKNPFDFALYHTLLWNVKPRTIIEIGSKSGGSALWMGDLLNSYGIDGHIYSLDIVKVTDVSHPRVTFMEADGRNLQNYLTPEFLAKMPRPLLVIEDADHTYETSIATLRFFHPWLKKDEYIIVEDGIISDMLQLPNYDSGPHRALKEFIGEYHADYEMDPHYCDFFGYNFTWCTNGYLRKLS